jgi:hypothetical protein
MDNNYGGTLNRILNIICSKTVLSAICVVASGLLVLSFLKTVSFEAYIASKDISTLYMVLGEAYLKNISKILRFFEWAKYLYIYVFIVSFVNAIRKKEIDYTVISALSVINVLIMIINSSTIKIFKTFSKINLSDAHDVTESLYNNASVYKYVKDPNLLIDGIKGELGFGIFFLVIFVIMFFYFLKQPNTPYSRDKFSFALLMDSLMPNNSYENKKKERIKYNQLEQQKYKQVQYDYLKKHTNILHCPKCGKRLEKNMHFCPYCGVKVNQSQAIQDELLRKSGKKRCICCGNTFKIEMNFCPFCGEKYDRKVVSSNTSFAGEHPFFKSYYVQLFTEVDILSKLGIILGSILFGSDALLYGVANFMKADTSSSTMNNMNTFINMLKCAPYVYYPSVALCIFISIFAFIRILMNYNIKVLLLSIVTAINSYLLLGSSNTIKLIRAVFSLDKDDLMKGKISASLINTTELFYQNPEQAMKDLTFAFGFGLVVLCYSIYLYVQCKKDQSVDIY